MEEQTSTEPEQVEYNLSAFKIGWIAELMRKADLYYLSGHIDKAFECWKCIYGHIRSRLTEKEDKFFKKKEGLFRTIHKRISDQKTRRSYEAFYYEMYLREGQKMLKKYGFDIRERETQEHLV